MLLVASGTVHCCIMNSTMSIAGWWYGGGGGGGGGDAVVLPMHRIGKACNTIHLNFALFMHLHEDCPAGARTG